jgi:hypothetical protein
MSANFQREDEIFSAFKTLANARNIFAKPYVYQRSFAARCQTIQHPFQAKLSEWITRRANRTGGRFQAILIA